LKSHYTIRLDGKFFVCILYIIPEEPYEMSLMFLVGDTKCHFVVVSTCVHVLDTDLLLA